MRSDLDEIRQICSGFPEAEEGLLQDRPLFHVRRRRFAIYNGNDAPYRKRWEGFERSLHFATDPATFARLELSEGFVASPHHGFRGWMAMTLADGIDWSEVSELLLQAYLHVANKKLVAQMNAGHRDD